MFSKIKWGVQRSHIFGEGLALMLATMPRGGFVGQVYTIGPSDVFRWFYWGRLGRPSRRCSFRILALFVCSPLAQARFFSEMSRDDVEFVLKSSWLSPGLLCFIIFGGRIFIRGSQVIGGSKLFLVIMMTRVNGADHL